MDGFKTFDKYDQPAVIPHLPFHGLAENLAVTYFDEHWAYVTRKIKRTVWSDEICHYINDYKDENPICLNIEAVCPQCNFCNVGTQSILFSSSSIQRTTFVTQFAKGYANLINYTTSLCNIR